MKDKYSAYVKHPIYGRRPSRSAHSFTLEEIRESFWRYQSENIFPESAIPANTSLQNYSTFPCGIYVDIKKQCKDCNKKFIFFAKEQKFWFEELKFYIDADCIRCINCRKTEKKIKLKAKLYEELLKTEKRSLEETEQLKKIANELYEYGYIKNKNKISQIS